MPGPLEPAGRAVWRALREGVLLARNALARPHPRPVFVLGNQKSGTSAIAALLGLAAGLPTSIDLRREIEEQTWLRLRNGEMSFDDFMRRNALDFSRAIVKEPNLTFFHRELRRRFPEARFAFVLRDPRDNLRSILDRLGIPGDLPVLTEGHCGGVDPGSELVLDSRWLGIEGGDHYVDRLAARWNACTDVYLAHRGEMVLIRYEDFIAGKSAEIARLARELGLPEERDIEGQVDVQFQPRGQAPRDWRVFFGEENLRRIERSCAQRMSEVGYAASSPP
ncbi:MAG: sulfotransferase [Proteobacteria bacterium]|nr:sulfotransferase [Pseudomonadota bacterium]